MKFESLSLNPEILKGVSDAGFEHCTPIQEQSLPSSLEGKDIIAQSQTGTGKTAVFLLTIFSKVLADGPSPSGKPRALVMVPTRELATQVIDDSIKLSKHIPFKSVAIYGGVEYNKQINALKEGVDLVVATPGRMIDLYKSKTLSLDAIEIFVIDEADRMFDMGFAPDIMYIAGRLPKGKPRQTMLFSATIDSNVRRLASRYMKPDPVMIEIEPEQVTVNLIDQKIIYVSNKEKLPVLLTLLKRPGVERAIIFTNMKSTAEKVGWKLTANGLPAKVLTGDVTQERRQKIIDGMKLGKVNILVATDVAARGLHIDGVSHVINYDLPDDAANYVHRIGRTARAGKSGQSFSLVCEDHVYNLPEIEKYIERKLESEWIEESELVKDAAPHAERPRGDKPFEKREKRPDGQRRQGKGPSSHGKGPSSRDRKEQPAQAKAQHQHPRPERKAVEPGTAVKPEGQHRRPRPEKKAEPGTAVKTEGQPQQNRRPRPDRKRSFVKKDLALPEKRGVERPVEQHRTRHTEAFAPVPAKNDEKKKSAAPEKSEAGPKEKKGGLLKRFLKFIKKS